MDLLAGEVLGNCRLLRRLGAGGMGEVYLAEQLDYNNRPVAVKIVWSDILPASPATKRFKREAELLGQLAHPNILPVYFSGADEMFLFIVMQYIPNGSLADVLKARRAGGPIQPFALPVVASFIGQIAAALEYTHSRGIVHRDVKPANVLVRIEPDRFWRLLLADFGIAHSLNAERAPSQVLGTSAYMAPEQFKHEFSPASDQYALGVVAYELLAGRTPFTGDLAALERAHTREHPPSLRSLNRSVLPSVERVVARALAKKPARRFPSVTAFAEALRAAAIPAS